jgi:hypothetical protein
MSLKRGCVGAILGLLCATACLPFGRTIAAPGDAGSGSGVAAWPGDARADLVLPAPLWQEILAKVGHAGRPLGYTPQEMGFYGRDDCRMRTVTNLFGDVNAIARFSGSKAEQFVAAAKDPASLVEQAFLLTDMAAGRNLPLPDSTSWGVPWLADTVTPQNAILDVLSYVPAELGGEEGKGRGSIESRNWEQWILLPDAVQRLVVGVFIGAAEAAPWLRQAYDAPFLEAAVFGSESDASGETATRGRTGNAAGSRPGATSVAVSRMNPAWIREAYAFATAPWVEDRQGQMATVKRAAFEALQRTDRNYLAFGSMIFAAHVRRALDAYQLEAGGILTVAAFRGCEFDTYFGKVRILGTGSSTVDEPAFLSVDVGGSDVYKGRQAVPAGLDAPVAVLIDLGGDDVYDGGNLPAAMACGLFGIGAIFDLEGNDVYRVAESGLGAGWYGTGLLVDYGGNDRYTVDQHWGEGAGCAGVGILADLAGDDAYMCGFDSQAFGSTYGAGVLLDVKGNDQYVARDDGNVSALYNNQSVAMSQGCGCGRRADLGDGHSLAGGFGVLVDGAGDDLYHATAWSQGAAYWWSVGILEDLGGNDTYRNGKYSLGAGAHFAIGCQVDREGNDRYNIGNAATVNQYQGHARDGSIGISIDGDGDDQYLLKSHCGGSGDLGSIGFFWDRRGNDIYHVEYTAPEKGDGWSDTPPLGTTTSYKPFRSFRDEIDVTGIFLDTGGTDQYAWPSGPARNDQEWRSQRGAHEWGIGVDTWLYPAAER